MVGWELPSQLCRAAALAHQAWPSSSPWLLLPLPALLDAELNRHKNKEELKQHPEYKRFKEWRQKHAAGDPGAGSAYAGKIPHDILHHITTTDHEDL